MAWTEYCEEVKLDETQDRICSIKDELNWSREYIGKLVKPLLKSYVFNTTLGHINQGLLVHILSIGVPLRIGTADSDIETLVPTMNDDKGGIYFRLDRDYDYYGKLQPFEWTSPGMKIDYHSKQDNNHRLDLCAKQSTDTNNGMLEFYRISALRKSKKFDCTKLALGENFVDDFGIHFQIIQVDEPSKCLTRVTDSESSESISSQAVGFRFETCEDIHARSDQVFSLARNNFLGCDSDSLLIALGPEFSEL